jgi:hypothetical protein
MQSELCSDIYGALLVVGFLGTEKAVEARPTYTTIIPRGLELSGVGGAHLVVCVSE